VLGRLYVCARPWYSMASKVTQETTDEYVEMFPDWVYQIPGLVLIAAGFGGVAYLSLL